MPAYFSPEHTCTMRRIFTELSDLIHREGIEQIVSCGPSATPYGRALVRAYRNRHGKTLKVVHLGEVGEKLVVAEEGDSRYPRTIWTTVKFGKPRIERVIEPPKTPPRLARHLLQTHRPQLDLAKHSLLLEDVISTGTTMERISDVFSELGLPHKTATIARIPYAEGSTKSKKTLDYVGVRSTSEIPFFLGRGIALKQRPTHNTPKNALSQYLFYAKQIREELRAIANSVPKVEK